MECRSGKSTLVSSANMDGLITIPFYQWEHLVVVPPEHPWQLSKNITLEEIATYPIITDAADVIKTYVELGMGIGSIAGMAYDAERDKNLRAISIGHLFGTNVSREACNSPAFRSEEHTSELQSLIRNSYAVFCLTKTTTANSIPTD